VLCGLLSLKTMVDAVALFIAIKGNTFTFGAPQNNLLKCEPVLDTQQKALACVCCFIMLGLSGWGMLLSFFFLFFLSVLLLHMLVGLKY
jgi:hypothetical protein